MSEPQYLKDSNARLVRRIVELEATLASVQRYHLDAVRAAVLAEREEITEIVRAKLEPHRYEPIIRAIRARPTP